MAEIKDKPNFIDITPEQDEQMLVSKYEDMTKKELYPAQNERILISLIAYYANLVKNQFNEAARLNLAQFSRSPILECIGEQAGCSKLKADYGKDVLEIEFFEPFTNDITIDAGLEIQSKDGNYIFKTIEDLIIPAGETVGRVDIVCTTATSDVNRYGAGDINTLIKPFTYIKSVKNINGVTGGRDEEKEESYIERILLAPESYTCAGSYGAYIYHTKSAHQSIVDVEAESPQLPATITTTEDDVDTAVVESNGVINGGEFSATVDYKTGTVIFNYADKTFKIVVPPAATVLIYPLTESGVLTDDIRSAIEEKLADKDILPMTDYPKIVEPSSIEKEFEIVIVLENDADRTTVKSLVTSTINDFCTDIRKTLGYTLVASHIISQIGNIKGVYDVRLNIEEQTAKLNEYFDLKPKIVFKDR